MARHDEGQEDQVIPKGHAIPDGGLYGDADGELNHAEYQDVQRQLPRCNRGAYVSCREGQDDTDAQ